MFENFSLSKLQEKFQRLSQREQFLLIVVLGVVLYFLVDALVFGSQKRREQDLLNKQQVLQGQIVTLLADIAAVDKVRLDQIALKEQEFRQLKKQADLLETVTNSVSTEPPKIRQLMAEVLSAQHARVKATAVKTLPVKLLPGTAPAQAAGGKPAPGGGAPVYKHGLEIELRGRYLDLMAYLNNLEEAHPNLFWSDASLSANEYPESVLRASVFLLSNRSNL